MEQEKKKVEAQLLTTIDRDTSSIKLMNEYDGYGEENDTIYEQLVLLCALFIRLDSEVGDGYWSDLIIERRKNRECVGNITFTQLKTSQDQYFELRDYVKDEIDKASISGTIDDERILTFSKPYLFRAQNSGNRIGYGSEWMYGEQIIQGTLYGETNDYAIIGTYLHSDYRTDRYYKYMNQRCRQS